MSTFPAMWHSSRLSTKAGSWKVALWHPQATNNGMKKIESKDVIKNLLSRKVIAIRHFWIKKKTFIIEIMKNHAVPSSALLFCFNRWSYTIKYPKTHFRKITEFTGRDPKPLIHTAKCVLLFFSENSAAYDRHRAINLSSIWHDTHSIIIINIIINLIIAYKPHYLEALLLSHEDKASPKILTTVSITTKQNSSPLNEHARN